MKKRMIIVTAQDAGRGIRRVVPSPKPVAILEMESIRGMVEEGQIVIACGGGGVPVVKNENGDYIGTEAIIDKDFASEKLAEELEADPHTIEVHIGRIRERFKDNPDFEIVTMRGIGYKVVKK